MTREFDQNSASGKRSPFISSANSISTVPCHRPPFTSRRSHGIGHAKMNRTSIENFSITTRRKFWPKIPLGPNFFCTAFAILSRSLLFFTVVYSSLRHDICPLICGRFSFHSSRLFQAHSRRLASVVHNDHVCATQQPRVCAS